MKYFIDNCHHCSEKIYLDIHPLTKKDLLTTLGETFNVECPYCHQIHVCLTENIMAENDQPNLPIGIIVGGFLGTCFAGPAGALGAGIIGGFLGFNADIHEEKLIDSFNHNLEIEEIANPFFMDR